MIELFGKTFIVTGAASGIGRETAIVTSRQGARIVMLDLSEEGLKETFSLLKGEGHSYHVIDLTDINSIIKLVKEIVAEVECVNGLVHCAGISSRKPLNVLTKDGFSKVMDINFYSFVELVRQVCKKKYIITVF